MQRSFRESLEFKFVLFILGLSTVCIILWAGILPSPENIGLFLWIAITIISVFVIT